MKSLRILILTMAVMALAVTAMASDYVQAPAPGGFRGLTWGTPLEDVQGLAPVTKSGFKDTFFRQNEKLTLGEADIRSVAYYFRKGKLYRVGVAFNGRANQFFLKDMLIQQYGPGRGVGFRYGWMWPEFSIEISYDDKKKSGALTYTFEGPLD